MPYFGNMDAGRGPPILSRTSKTRFGARDGLAWEHLEMIRRRFPASAEQGRCCIRRTWCGEADRVDGVMVSNMAQASRSTARSSGLRMQARDRKSPATWR